MFLTRSIATETESRGKLSLMIILILPMSSPGLQ